MPYEDDDKEELTRSRARKGLDAEGNPLRNPPPPKPPAPPPVKFTKPFTDAERAKQAAAFQKALRKHEDEY
jgi:hypothetical protein